METTTNDLSGEPSEGRYSIQFYNPRVIWMNDKNQKNGFVLLCFSEILLIQLENLSYPISFLPFHKYQRRHGGKSLITIS